MPQAASDKARSGLRVDVIARIRTLPAGAGPRCGEVGLRVTVLVVVKVVERVQPSNARYLVRGQVVAEPNIPVNTEVDVFKRQLRDRLVDLNDLLRHGLDERLPVLQCPSILGVVD